ncbi:MAG: restriction endonuclease [Chloroflexi bacterium]|nr:restriction endonuclease [Chloroflexota bacterium]
MEDLLRLLLVIALVFIGMIALTSIAIRVGTWVATGERRPDYRMLDELLRGMTALELIGIEVGTSVGMRERRADYRTLDGLLQLSPRQFEEAVADLLRKMGYRDVKRVGRAGNLGVDILCRDNRGHTVVV